MRRRLPIDQVSGEKDRTGAGSGSVKPAHDVLDGSGNAVLRRDAGGLLDVDVEAEIHQGPRHVVAHDRVLLAPDRVGASRDDGDVQHRSLGGEDVGRRSDRAGGGRPREQEAPDDGEKDEPDDRDGVEACGARHRRRTAQWRIFPAESTVTVPARIPGAACRRT